MKHFYTIWPYLNNLLKILDIENRNAHSIIRQLLNVLRSLHLLQVEARGFLQHLFDSTRIGDIYSININ